MDLIDSDQPPARSHRVQRQRPIARDCHRIVARAVTDIQARDIACAHPAAPPEKAVRQPAEHAGAGDVHRFWRGQLNQGFWSPARAHRATAWR